MSFHTLTSFKSIQTAFGRAVGPLLIAGSLGLAGCSTVKKSELNWTTCDLTDSTSTIVGIPDVEIKGGEGVAGIINGLNLQFSKADVQQDQLCPLAKRIIRSTVIPQENGYNAAGLALLISFYTNPENDPRLKGIVATRMQQEFGFGPDEVIKMARERAEQLAKPVADVCKLENGRRVCSFDHKVNTPRQTP